MTGLVAPRRPVRTYVLHGREIYADTGRPVDEVLGSHVVLWIVEDPEAWAAAIEAEGEALVAKAPRSQRGLAMARRTERFASAAQVRSEGSRRRWYAIVGDAAKAEGAVAQLRHSHPNPGVRYEVAEIAQVGACPDCSQPIVLADGHWRHHSLRYPAECMTPPELQQDDEPEPDGDWTFSPAMGQMICGYCHEGVVWDYTALGYLRLTGVHMLGRERATGRLVVMAEAEKLTGELVALPHHCPDIPDEIQVEYAADGRCTVEVS